MGLFLKPAFGWGAWVLLTTFRIRTSHVANQDHTNGPGVWVVLRKLTRKDFGMLVLSQGLYNHLTLAANILGLERIERADRSFDKKIEREA